MRYILISIFYLSIIYVCEAHGDLHARIEAVTARIAQSPNDLELYRQRGELYVQHEDYGLARKDLRRCERGGLKSARLWFYLATVYYHLDKSQRSLSYLRKILSENPKDIPALRLAALNHENLRRYQSASDFHQLVIISSIRPIPENFLEAASATLMSRDTMEAIEILEDGLSKLGPVPGLETELINCYLSVLEFDKALTLQDRIIARSNRKEFPLARRAEIHCSIGNLSSCQFDVLAAREAISSLPPRLQQNSSVLQLKNRLNGLMNTYLPNVSTK